MPCGRDGSTYEADSNLRVLEPYRPLFLAAALVAPSIARRQIFRPAPASKPGEVCAVPQVRATYKTLFLAVAALVNVT